MAAPKKTQYAHMLMSAFEQEFERRCGKKPNINRYKCKYGFQAMCDQYGYDQSLALVKYFFRTDSRPFKTDKLLYEYEEYYNAMLAADAAAEERRRVREQSRLMAEEWRLKNEL